VFENGLFNIIKTNIPDFWGTNNNGDAEYQLFYLGVFDPVSTPPYAIFERYKRIHEMDMKSKNRQFISGYRIEIYDKDSWHLLDLQQRLRTLLESLAWTTVGGIYVEQIEVEDDFHTIPNEKLESKLRLYQGVLDFNMYYTPE